MRRDRLRKGLGLLLALLLSGCWDRREIEEKSTVLASSVDLCPADAGCNIRVARQIAIPGRIPLGGAATGGKENTTVFVITSDGIDGPDTARKAQAELNRLITFGHIRVLVWSEAFARRGVSEFVDYVRRVPDVRRGMMILIADGSAEEVIRARPRLERVPALFLSDMLEDAVKAGRLPRVYWGDFLIRLSNKGEDAIAPLIRMAGPDEPELAGLAVFRGDRMVGKLSLEETATHLQLRGRSRGAEVITVEEEQGGHVDLRVYARKTSYNLAWMQGRVHATIMVELESDLVSASENLALSAPGRLEEIERLASATATGKATAYIERLQHEFGADILALGERVRAYLPKVWMSIGDWNAAFADAQIRAEVTVHIRRTGMGVD